MTTVDDNVVALVPMRHHSTRVPGKNFRELGGVPLFYHIVRTLMSCSGISQIVINTNSDTIRNDVALNFPSVTIVDRPDHLNGDDVPMTEIISYDIERVPADTYLQTHSTSPFVRAETIDAALSSWKTARTFHDSLFSVSRTQARLWDGTGRPMNHNPWILMRTQDLTPIYIENSAFYIFPWNLVKTSRRRIGDRPKLFEIDPLEAIDIDDEQGFQFAEQTMRFRMG